jgi:hypothetical protein
VHSFVGIRAIRHVLTCNMMSLLRGRTAGKAKFNVSSVQGCQALQAIIAGLKMSESGLMHFASGSSAR